MGMTNEVETGPGAGERTARVLLVDDDAGSRRSLANALGSAYEIREAVDGVEALVVLSKWIPHAIVSDWEMPRMNGLQLTRALKGKRTFRSVPVILVTSRTERGAVHDCFEAGAADYLAKPVDPLELGARVGAAVRSSQLAEDLAESNRRLMINSRRAGQAEVATGVLHNVGNALNSVNVSIKLLREKAGLDVVSRLAKLTEFVRERAPQLEQALGDAGTDLCDYLDALSTREAAEKRVLADEIGHLEQVVDHAKVVISGQQAFARGVRLVAPLRVSHAVQLAEHVAQAALGDLRVEKTLSVESAEGDECRIVQVLANLLSNAAQAVALVERPRVALSCYEDPSERTLHFVVEDNGVGIALDVLPNIFAHGASTKGSQGSGFGLHHSINAAREMDGDLLARSDGPGTGARFELVLPLGARESWLGERDVAMAPQFEGAPT